GTNIATVDWTVTGPQVVALWYEETSVTAVDTCFGTSDTLYITINPSPATGPISGPINVCVSDSGSFSVVGTANSTYNWLINGGTILSGNGTNSITANWTAGTIIISVVETNSYGCVGDTVSLTVTVHALPNVSAGSDVSVCNGLGVQLNASGGVSYVWSPSTGLSNSTIANPIASPTVATNYIVYVTDTFGCKNSDTVLVSVNALPVITITPNSPLCYLSSIQLNASANGATSYQWSPPTGLSSTTISSPVANPTTTTTYTVVVTDINTCVSSSSVTITVNPLPTITASVSTDTICAGASATLSANGGASYVWSPTNNLNNSAANSPVITAPTGISSVTLFSYTVTGTDANGCKNTANVSFEVNPTPEASFTVDDANLDSLTCFGYTGSLHNTSVNANTYQWILPGGTSTDVNPQVQLALSGDNNIVLIATNNMCRDTFSLDFTSTAVAQLFTKLPNVFTPNGDIKNECFDFGSHFNLKDCSQWEVYNRWGEKVFTSSPAKACWNGKKDGTGKELPAGTYYILVNISGQSYKGTITLIRKTE
ncbi:MAG: gliding motility-associated C-terminal domain-containing protein, partial [Bacteroidota bacterium]